jgi:hypothetical protein
MFYVKKFKNIQYYDNTVQCRTMYDTNGVAQCTVPPLQSTVHL